MQLQRLEHILQTQAGGGTYIKRLIHDTCKSKQKVASCNIMSLEAIQSALPLKLSLVAPCMATSFTCKHHEASRLQDDGVE